MHPVYPTGNKEKKEKTTNDPKTLNTRHGRKTELTENRQRLACLVDIVHIWRTAGVNNNSLIVDKCAIWIFFYEYCLTLEQLFQINLFKLFSKGPDNMANNYVFYIVRDR